MWCAPVPNAWPGSITRSMPSPSSGGSQGGRTRSRRKRQLTSTGRWNCLPALGPVVGHLRAGDVDQRVTGRGSQRGQRRQLPRRAVDHVLDVAVVELALLQPARRQLEQLGEHRLRVGPRDAHREPDHARSTHGRPLALHAPLRLAHPVARERLDDLAGALREHARGDHHARAGAAARRPRSPAAASIVRFAVTVGAHGRGRRGQVEPVACARSRRWRRRCARSSRARRASPRPRRPVRSPAARRVIARIPLPAPQSHSGPAGVERQQQLQA